METLIPYLGVALVVMVGTLAVVFLSKNGFNIRKLKHNKIEIEFSHERSSQNQSPATSTPARSKRRILTKTNVQVSSLASTDCTVANISAKDVVEFVIAEGQRHSLLFAQSFSSISFIYRQYVVLVSWNSVSAIIERILTRTQAYPINDTWFRCLATYRQATLLPYRTRENPALHERDIHNALGVYLMLSSQMDEFIKLLLAHGQTPVVTIEYIETLIQEALFSFRHDNFAIAIARMEAALSTIHKFILHHAPQGPLKEGNQTIDARKTALTVRGETCGGEGVRSVLLLDDGENQSEFLCRQLEERFRLRIVKCTDVTSALRELVNESFDLMILDLVLGPLSVDGREVVIAARKASKETRIFVWTAYANMSIIGQIKEYGANEVFFKGQDLSKLIESVHKSYSA